MNVIHRDFGARGDTETPAPRTGAILTFRPKDRFCAVAFNAHVYGYMEHRPKDGTRLHFAANAPVWLKQVRDAGPYESHYACKAALEAARDQEYGG